jgi:hypothetical protein
LIFETHYRTNYCVIATSEEVEAAFVSSVASVAVKVNDPSAQQATEKVRVPPESPLLAGRAAVASLLVMAIWSLGVKTGRWKVSSTA